MLKLRGKNYFCQQNENKRTNHFFFFSYMLPLHIVGTLGVYCWTIFPIFELSQHYQ